MKKLRLMLLVAAVLSLSACSSQTGTPEPAPQVEAPKEEAPKEEAPKEEAPKEEAPKEEAPKEEAPKEETAEEETPNPILYENTLTGLVDLSDVENSSQLDYDLTLDGEYSALVHGTIKTKDGQVVQEIEYQSNMDQYWYEDYTSIGGEIIRFFDVNFDGYTDLVCQFMGAMPNQNYVIWLYNADTEQFEISEEYDSLINPKVDIENQLILSSNYAMSNIDYEVFQVIDGHIAHLGQLEIGENPNYTEKMYAHFEDGELVFQEVQSLVETDDASELSSIWDVFGVIE